MSDICCLLDACTVINLIHIDDEDDFILKKLGKLDIHINELVFSEVKINVYDRLSNTNISKYSNKIDLEKNRKLIDQKLVFFRGKKNSNENLLNDLGENYFEKIKKETNYTKRINGELCSTAYALYLSRCNEKKVYFYTDDSPAKQEFTPFFDYQQIGHIKDTVDLIILLYWLDENFTAPQLKNILSELHSQYAIDVKLLHNALENFQKDNVDAKYKRTYKDASDKLSKLIYQLRALDFKGIIEIKSFFEHKRSKHKAINDILDNFSSVFDLDNGLQNGNFLEKINRALKTTHKVHKYLDLCS